MQKYTDIFLLHVTESRGHLLALPELRVNGTLHLWLHHQRGGYGNWSVYYVR